MPSFEIPNYLPPSLNDLLRCHWRKRNRLKREAAQLVGVYFSQSDIPKARAKRVVQITLRVPNRSHRQDDDNCRKLILDGLRDCGAIVNDSQEWCLAPPVLFEKGRRSVVIQLEDVNGE